MHALLLPPVDVSGNTIRVTYQLGWHICSVYLPNVCMGIALEQDLSVWGEIAVVGEPA